MGMLHGGDIYKTQLELGLSEDEILDFSANISPLGIPEGVIRAVTEHLKGAVHYPDPSSRRLRMSLSEALSVPEDWIICGNGAADIIYRFIFSKKPKRALVPAPTFVEYEEAMRCVGTEVLHYNLNHVDFKIGMDFIDRIDDGVDAVFVCNPNNPTGVLTSRTLLLEILHKAAACGACLVIDECFLDFLEDEARYTLVDALGQSGNLLILKSFTKMYAIPGIRLGYGLCSDAGLIEHMQKAGQSWPVSTLAEAAGIAALLETDYRKQVIEYVNRERHYLEKAFDKLGIRYIHGHANYMLIQTPGVNDLSSRLLPSGIMIRTCESYHNLNESYYRIAVNGRGANEKLIGCLETALSDCK